MASSARCTLHGSLLSLVAAYTASDTALPGISCSACVENGHHNVPDFPNFRTSPLFAGLSIWPANTGLLSLRSRHRHQLLSDPTVTSDARQSGDGPSNTCPGYVIDNTADLQLNAPLAHATSCRTIYEMSFFQVKGSFDDSHYP